MRSPRAFEMRLQALERALTPPEPLNITVVPVRRHAALVERVRYGAHDYVTVSPTTYRETGAPSYEVQTPVKRVVADPPPEGPTQPEGGAATPLSDTERLNRLRAEFGML